jgi:serine/threonine-protein kinase
MDASVEVGDILAGKYAVERILASGGNGIVVLARHLQLLEPCAVKLLQRDVLFTPQAEERFLREARAVAQLKSDHVVRVFDVGQLDDGTPYMVMERLEGIDLEALLEQRGALPVDEAALYALQICAALAEAHRRGIVHRDLKPANVFVTHTADGEPRLKLLDFGIAKMLAAPEGVDPMTTLEGTIMGTPLFMAPEQIAGGVVDPRTDLWALGVLLYRLLTGHLPFGSSTAAGVASLAKILAQAPPPPSAHRPSIPAELERIILHCLEKRAGARPASVGEVAEALAPFAGDAGAPLSRRVRRVLDHGANSSVPPPPRATAALTLAAAASPQRSWTIPVLAATAIALAAVAGFALTHPSPSPRAANTPVPTEVRLVVPSPDLPAAESHAAKPAPDNAASPPVLPAATVRPAAPAITARPAPASPSAGFDWGDRH